MSAEETQPDWTTASGSKTFELFAVGPGWKIQQFVGAINSTHSFTDNDHEEDVAAGSGPVATYTFSGDDSGDDAGVHTSVHVRFNQLKVELVEDGNCVSPMNVHFLEAQGLINLEYLNQFEAEIGTAQPLGLDLQQRLAPQLDSLPLIPAASNE